MSIAIVSHYLTRNAELTAIVPAANIFPIVTPQTISPPFIILSLISMVDGKKIDGEDEYPVSRIMVECVSPKATEAYRIGDLVRKALRNIIKQTALSYTDIDITSTEVDFTDQDDNRTTCRRALQFRVRWRDA